MLKEISVGQANRGSYVPKLSPWIQINPGSFLKVVNLHPFIIAPCIYNPKDEFKITIAGENLDF